MATSRSLFFCRAAQHGGHIGSEKTRDKLLLGTQLADKTGGKVRYFMVFDENPMQAAGSYSFDAFKSNILPNLM